MGSVTVCQNNYHYVVFITHVFSYAKQFIIRFPGATSASSSPAAEDLVPNVPDRHRLGVSGSESGVNGFDITVKESLIRLQVPWVPLNTGS